MRLDSTLQALLNGTFADPDGGPPLNVPTRAVAVEDSLDGQEAEWVKKLDLGRRLAVVSDPETRVAFGHRVERALDSLGKVVPIVLPSHPHADLPTAERIEGECQQVDALVAVGSGTINDLCKFVAARLKKPYVVFGTAPSMNGYTSVNAAITVEGLKKTLPAVGARGVFLDLGVLRAAPKRLIQAGLGDSICRCTAQADWLLAHLLLGTEYRTAPFVLLAQDEDILLSQAGALVAGDLEALRHLARTLILSGFGMTICNGSYPASQGEHLISHTLEMLGSPDWPETFHGEQIGVTTLTMVALQSRLLTQDKLQVRPSIATRADLEAYFGKQLGEMCWRELSPKRLDAAAAEAMTDRLGSEWNDIRQQVAGVLRPRHALERALRDAGCPTTPEALHWPRPAYLDAVRHAREIRNRYTFLDLAADTGALEDSSFIT